MKRLVATGLVAPAVTGLGGGVGIWLARENLDSAPAIVGVALALAAAAVVLRQRGIAIGALGVAAAAAFVSPAGLGPLLVATGVIVGTSPAAIDRRLARWPEVVDGLICIPALAGLASVVAAQPSVRGVATGVGAGLLAVGSWWRGPRHGVGEAERESVLSYVGVAGAVLLVGAPELFDVLGVLPDATTTAGRGLVAASGVFALGLVMPQMRRIRANPTNPSPALAVERRRADSTNRP